MDKLRAENAVRELLVALDRDVDCEALRDTPKRVAETFIQQCSERPFTYQSFQEVKHEELTMVRDVPVSSYCAHHLLPWFGRAVVVYIPRKKVVGISKLVRLVYACSTGFTTQEGVTKDVADRLYNDFEPLGVMVAINAVHTCMSLRGAKAFGASTVTSAVRGVMRDNPTARQEALALMAWEIKQ